MEQLLNFDIYFYIFVICSATLAALLITNFVLHKFYSRRAQHTQDIVDESYITALNIIEDAKKKAFQTISDAEKEASAIVNSAAKLTEQSKEELRDKTSKLIQHNLQVLDETAKSVSAEYRRVMKSELEEDIHSLKETFEKEAIESQQELSKKAMDEYEKMKRDLQEYKMKKIHEIDTRVAQTVSEISTKLLGNAVSLSEHERMVLKVLEDAKESLKVEIQ